MFFADTLAQFGILSDTGTADTAAAEPTPAADGVAQVVAQPLLVLESVMQALEEPFQKMLSLAGAAVAPLSVFAHIPGLSGERMEAWMAVAKQRQDPLQRARLVLAASSRASMTFGETFDITMLFEPRFAVGQSVGLDIPEVPDYREKYYKVTSITHNGGAKSDVKSDKWMTKIALERMKGEPKLVSA